MQVVDPKVSTDCNCFTSTFEAAIFFAARDIHTVIVIIRPSGRFATMIPIIKPMLVIIPYPKAKLTQKKNIPMTTAILPTMTTNLWSSLEIGVSPFSAVCARLAIYPMTELSPVLKTIPIPLP
jgi:hypothetical protein